jgi:hypothetical protein
VATPVWRQPGGEKPKPFDRSNTYRPAMAEFTLHIRLDADRADASDGEGLLSPYVEAHETVEFGSDRVEGAGPGVVVPEPSSLEIADIETFAEVYTGLRTEPAVHDISLWGPSSERFPVPVQHYALQQIQQPRLYEYHALGDTVTLVIADSEMAAEQVQREVPEAALGYSNAPF